MYDQSLIDKSNLKKSWHYFIEANHSMDYEIDNDLNFKT